MSETEQTGHDDARYQQIAEELTARQGRDILHDHRPISS
jgi:hypothetical protein